MISSFFFVKVIKQLPEKKYPNAVICIAAGNDDDWTWGGLDLGNQGPRRGRAAAAIAIMPTWADTRNVFALCVCVCFSISLSLLQLSQTPMTSAHHVHVTANQFPSPKQSTGRFIFIINFKRFFDFVFLFRLPSSNRI